MQDEILSYREMCDMENVQILQRGMNFRLNPKYSLILMSQRSNAPYKDRILEDGVTVEYEGHDVNKNSNELNPKKFDQTELNIAGTLTQNGYFIKAVKEYRQSLKPELVKIYEKIMPGVWSLKGFFDLIDFRKEYDGVRQVYIFTLRLSDIQGVNNNKSYELQHTRLIPSQVKKEVWKRDSGKCVLCGESKNLHFDHDLPFSRGGTSLTSKNIRLLCMECNLAKSAKIE